MRQANTTKMMKTWPHRFDVPPNFTVDNARSLLVAAALCGANRIVFFSPASLELKNELFFSPSGLELNNEYSCEDVGLATLLKIVKYVHRHHPPKWGIGWMNTSLASKPAKFVFIDESDKWDVSSMNERDIFDQPEFFTKHR